MLRSRESPLLHDFAVVCREGSLSRAAQFTRTVCLAIKKEKASSYLLMKAQEQIMKVIVDLVLDGSWPANIIDKESPTLQYTNAAHS